MITEHPDVHAIIVRSEKITSKIIDALPDLKIIVRAGAGYNTIDTKYARKKGVDVMNTPGANANAVAEEVVALMLADARHLIPGDISCRQGKWEKKNHGKRNYWETVGIVGFGAIGQLVAKRLSGFDVKILALIHFLKLKKLVYLMLFLLSSNKFLKNVIIYHFICLRMMKQGELLISLFLN